MRNKTITNEMTEIMRQLTPENQQYFLTLMRIAAVAENSVKKQEQFDETIQRNVS